MQDYQDLQPELEQELELFISLLNEDNETLEFKLIDTFFVEEREYFIISPTANEENEVWIMQKENDKLIAIDDEEEYYMVIDAYQAYIEQKEID